MNGFVTTRLFIHGMVVLSRQKIQNEIAKLVHLPIFRVLRYVCHV